MKPIEFTPFRVKIHEENVPYEIRRIQGHSILGTDVQFKMLIAQGKIWWIKGHWTFTGPNGWLPMKAEEIESKYDMEELKIIAMEDGEILRSENGQIVEYLDDEPRKRIVVPMRPDGQEYHYGYIPSDETKVGDTYYVGYSEKQIEKFIEVEQSTRYFLGG